MSYSLIWKKDRLVQKYLGNVSPDEILEANKAIYGDPRYDTLKIKIADFSDVRSSWITHDDIQTVASIDKASAVWNKRLKVAVLAPAKMRQYAQQYKEQLQSTDWEISFFTSRKELEYWLEHRR